VIDAELRVERQLLHKRHAAHPDQFQGFGRNIAVDRDAALHAARLGLAEVGVPKLGGEAAVN